MDIYRVTFMGHREIYNSYKVGNELEKLIGDLLRKKEYVEFYVGRNGDFDQLASYSHKRVEHIRF